MRRVCQSVFARLLGARAGLNSRRVLAPAILVLAIAFSLAILGANPTPASAHHCAAISPWGTTNDDDCDGYSLDKELYMGTDPIQACARTSTRNDEAIDPWPPDFDDNQAVNGSDFLTFAPYYGHVNVYGPPDSRWDLNMDHRINGSDYLMMAPAYGRICSFIPLNKNIMPHRWYHQLVCNPSCDYFDWMTLDDHRHIAADNPGSGLYNSLWNSAIDNARAAWDVAPNTVYIQQFENPASTADIHFWADGEVCWGTQEPFYNGTYDGCFYGPQVAATWLIGPGPSYELYCTGPNCPQPQPEKTVYYAVVALREDGVIAVTPDAGYQAIIRQSNAAHEIGHVMQLAHDNSVANPEVQDGDCIKPTIMDYDCYLPISPTTHQYDPNDPAAWANVLINSQPWDSCGVNHAYYDPNWGYSGC